MTPQQARDIAKQLNAAADKAEADGHTHVDLLNELRSADDAAMAEFQAAIADAKKEG